MCGRVLVALSSYHLLHRLLIAGVMRWITNEFYCQINVKKPTQIYHVTEKLPVLQQQGIF